MTIGVEADTLLFVREKGTPDHKPIPVTLPTGEFYLHAGSPDDRSHALAKIVSQAIGGTVTLSPGREQSDPYQIQPGEQVAFELQGAEVVVIGRQ